MRIKITLQNDKLILPINYQSILQGLIYSIFNNCEYGDFLHDVGYRNGKKVFKNFVFSNLFGNYSIDNYSIVFQGDVYFYISSDSEEFMKITYNFLCENTLINLNKKQLKISSVKFEDLDYFKGLRSIHIKTLSPIVAYRTEGDYVSYFKPSDQEFEKLCQMNLEEKKIALEENEIDIFFQIEKVNYEKKRMVHFKNTFYESYLSDLVIKVNYDTLSLIYNTGLSSKGSAGFGMIKIVK